MMFKFIRRSRLAALEQRLLITTAAHTALLRALEWAENAKSVDDRLGRLKYIQSELRMQASGWRRFHAENVCLCASAIPEDAL